MSLSVGIHENIVLSKAALNDRGTLVIGFKKHEEIDLVAAMNTAGGQLEAGEQDFLIFSPTIKNFNGSMSSGEEIFKKKIKDHRDFLEHIMLRYVTADKISWNIFNGVEGLTPTNVYAKLEDEQTLNIVCKNIIKDFIRVVTPYVNNTSKLSRLKVIRKNNSNYVQLPKFPPFFESMEVPVTNLKFSPYEIANKLNKSLSGESETVSSTEAEEAKSLFA